QLSRVIFVSTVYKYVFYIPLMISSKNVTSFRDSESQLKITSCFPSKSLNHTDTGG
ncbi:Hypothetical protein FKW44_017918, partial [Caligus rogercresseyi]